MKWTSGGGGGMFFFPSASQAVWPQGRASSWPPNAPEINTFLMGEKSRDVGGSVVDGH